MTGVAYQMTAPELGEALERLGKLPFLVGTHRADLLEIAASVAESGTKRRIGEEKAGPDGEVWAPWAESYQSSRRLGQTLLQSDGGLLDSIAGEVIGNAAQVGSNLVYAAIQQMGGDVSQGHAPIPARPYLGLSDQDRRDLRDDLIGFLGRVL